MIPVLTPSHSRVEHFIPIMDTINMKKTNVFVLESLGNLTNLFICLFYNLPDGPTPAQSASYLVDLVSLWSRPLSRRPPMPNRKLRDDVGVES